MHGASTGARFSQNRRFRKSSEKTSILAPFSEAKIEKNLLNMVLKNTCFFISFFSVFFAIFKDFGSILGGPGPSKNSKKSEKSIFDRVQFRRRVLGGFGEGFGKVLGSF